MLVHRIAQRPRAARGVVLAVAALLVAGASPQAARIDSITPSSAARGEQVTITGIGFGAGNVQVSVGGVAAQVLAAIGNSATFRVPFGARPGATTVTATNPGGQSGSIAFTVVNRAPQANAGPDQTVFVTSTVQLNGAASSDADGDQLTFHWSFLSRPNGSNTVLSDPSAVRPTFVVDLPGRYTIRLIVNDGFADSPPDTVLVDTQNSPPTANAGPDQTVFVGATVQLDGSGSSDVDHDLLTFRWSFFSRPSGSNATLSDPTAPSPTFIVDLPGRYVVQLIVNDGTVDSRPDTVTIDTQNSRPVAHAGPDQIVTLGQTAQLDGSQSFDVDHDPLSFRWSFVSRPAGSTAAISDVTAVSPTFVPDLIGTYVVQLIVNDGTTDSQADTAVVTVNPSNRAPSVDAGPDQTITLPNTATLSGSATDDGLPPGSILAVAWSKVSGPGSVTFANASAAQTTAAFSQAGLYVLRLTASDGELSSSDDLRVTVNPANQAPSVDAGPDQTITLPAAATLNGTVTDDGLPPGSTLTIVWTAVSGPGTVTFADPSAASTTATFSPSGQYVLRLTANDSQLSSSDEVTVTVNPAAGGGVPPDPSTVAPPINPTVATNLNDATSFLYAGPIPIQTGVAPGTIVPTRVAVLRGIVTTRDGTPLPSVQITILNHPEFGQTLSRLDGAFDLAVNGGGVLTVNYVKTGFLPAQRQTSVPWQDYALLPTVALVSLDPQVTAVTLSATSPLQVAQGSVMTDADGSRRATLLFPQGTIATMTMPDGSATPLTTLSVRATEYTVGPNGPVAMPALLPPTSVYTYAVELSVDEAIAAGATAVTFSQPIIEYIENFLGFPTGGVVPVGLYDRGKSAWVPSDNGRVIAILSVNNGLAALDIDGSGQPATTAGLTALGITDGERAQLAQLYQPGRTLWRAPIPHFSTVDLNWAWGLPSDATAPNQGPPRTDQPPPQTCQSSGSIIDCQGQILGEIVPVTGEPFSLHYQSDRIPGRRAAYTIDIPLSGPQVPASLLGIGLEVQVAGRSFEQSFPPAPNQRTTFTWDGQDAYGRLLQGAQLVTIRIGYVYAPVYQPPPTFAGMLAGARATGFSIVRNQFFVVSQILHTTIGAWDARAHGLGAWSLTPHHAYDPVARILYLGGNAKRAAQNLVQMIRTVVGTGVRGFGGDGGPAISALINSQSSGAADIAAGPDGSLYLLDNDRVRKVGPDGIINTVAGGGTRFCDACPATQSILGIFRGAALAVGPDGSLYIGGFALIRRVGSDGVIRTIAGGGADATTDGIPASRADLGQVMGIAVAQDGSIYLTSLATSRVRRIGPDGRIFTVAGQFGTSGFAGDGGPAAQALLNAPRGIALGPDGSLYIADVSNNRVRRVGPDGIIQTVAGSGDKQGPIGDGGPATSAVVPFPLNVAVGPDGTLYVSEGLVPLVGDGRVRRIRTDGTITTVAGVGTQGFSGDGGPAPAAMLAGPSSLALAPDGVLFIADSLNNRIRQVLLALPAFRDQQIAIASEDGRELYQFDANGRHLRTLDALTRAVRFQFGYDSAGHLTTVTDASGNATVIEQDSAGNPTAVVAPGGQHTALTVDANGFLSSIRNPAGETVQFRYTNDGLLTSLTDPRAGVHRFTYDTLGRLIRDENPAGGVTTLTRTDTSNGFTLTLSTSLGRSITYEVQNLPTNEQMRLTTFPDGQQSRLRIGADGTQTATFADGTVITIVQAPDPRFGMQAPLPQALTVDTPGGRRLSVTRSRAVILADPGNVAMTDTVTVNGRTSTSTFDATSRTITTRTPAGRQTATILDSAGRVVEDRRPGLPVTRFGYDARGRLSTITRGTRVYSLSYDSQDRLAAITDPLTRTVGFEYDTAGRITSQTRSDGRRIAFTYDARGNAVSVTTAAGQRHNFTYTTADLFQDYTPPDVGAGPTSTHYDYNLDRQIVRVTRPGGTSTASDYDIAGRLSRVTLPAGPVTFAYDPRTGNLASVTTPDGGTLTYGYDGGLLTSTSWSGEVAGTVTRTYDADPRNASESVNGGSTIAFTYDSDGLLTQAGLLLGIRDPQSGTLTGTTLGHVADTRSYDAFDDLASYHVTVGDVETFAIQITRDPLGRITDKSETVGGVTETFAYGYDLAGRLTEVRRNGTTVATYAYDLNGNRMSLAGASGTVTGSYDAQDRLIRFGAQTYTYTINGDLANKTDAVTSAVTTYQYDPLGTLLGVTLPDGTKIDYVIDGQGRRIGKKVNSMLTQGFLYQNQFRPIAELDDAGTVVTRFVYGTKSNVPDYLIKGGNTYRVISDHLGSPRLVIDIATGVVVQRMDYDEWGNVVQDTNPGFQPFGFAGGIYDRDTKLTRLGARDYDAAMGRWTTKDPVGFLGGDTNLYGYARTDPVNRVDPWGLQDGYDATAALPPLVSTGSGTAAISSGPVPYDPIVSAITSVVSKDAEFRGRTDCSWCRSLSLSDWSGPLRNLWFELSLRDPSEPAVANLVCTGIAARAETVIQNAINDGSLSGVSKVGTIDRDTAGFNKFNHTAVLVETDQGQLIVLDWWKTLDPNNPVVSSPTDPQWGTQPHKSF